MSNRMSGAGDRLMLDAIERQWKTDNNRLFSSVMRPPVLSLHEGQGRLGFWRAEDRTLSLARSLAWGEPWLVVREVLLHEMAHQFVSEVSRVQEAPHGPVFRRVCAERGIDSRAAGLRAPNRGVGVEEPVVLRRVRKLLARAEGPDTGEARTASRLAWRMMARHGVDRALLDKEEARFEIRQVGGIRRRSPAWRQRLVSVLMTHWGVSAVKLSAFDPRTGTWGKTVEISGSPTHVEVAAWVYDWFEDAGERSWTRHKAASGARGVAAKNRYLHGLAAGFEAHLSREAHVAEQEEGLVWIGDPGLHRYVHRRYPRLSPGRGFTVRRDGHYQAGMSDGQALRWRRPVRDRGGRSGLALPPPPDE